MSIAAASNIDELFRLWKAARPEYTDFSDDGILDEKLWEGESPKIAFILKESNDGFCEIRGHSPYDPKGGNARQFWRNLNMWSYTVKKRFNHETPGFEEAVACKDALVGHIAYVNLKKNCECRPRSAHWDIQGYVVRDWEEFLERQIALISPDVLFCGGTFRYLPKGLKENPVGDRVYRWGKRTIIDFFHPSSRKGYLETFELLSSILRNLWPQQVS